MALHLSTYLTRSPAGLLNRIKYLAKEYAGHDLTLLFTLSANFSDTQDLGRAVTGLTNLTSTQTVGCLSGRLGSTRINDKRIYDDVLSLSVAVLDPKNVKPFRSTIPEREEREEIRVGRWHAFRRKNQGVNREYTLIRGVSWEEALKSEKALPLPEDPRTLDPTQMEEVPWEEVWEGGKALPLPEDLRTLDPTQIRNIIYLSDLKPEGLLSSFHHLPNATKLGLFASSTPFITGRPVTLFQNQEIFSSGAVGLAITGDISITTKPTFAVDFLDVRALSELMTITQCEGNMVNALDETNPTRLLISAIKKSGLDSHISGLSREDEQFSLGAFSENGKLDRLYRITAGDPSRGNISIDSFSTPPTGTRVQFLHRRSATPPNLSLPKSPHSFSFLTVSDNLKPSNSQQDESTLKEFDMLLENKFLATSENGFVFERTEHPRENVKCSVPGSLGSFQWSFV